MDDVSSEDLEDGTEISGEASSTGLGRFRMPPRAQRLPNRFTDEPEPQTTLAMLRVNYADCLNFFLREVALTGNVTRACMAIGTSDRVIRLFRKENPRFAEAWDEAQAIFTAALEDELIRRAVEGVDEPIYHQGRLVGYKRVFSDSLLTALMRKRDPEWRAALSAPGTSVTVNASQTLQNAQGAAIADPATLAERMRSLSPEERAVLLKVLGPQVPGLLPASGTTPLPASGTPTAHYTPVREVALPTGARTEPIDAHCTDVPGSPETPCDTSAPLAKK